VLVIEFLIPPGCPACLSLAVLLNTLRNEFASRGFDALVIAYDAADPEQIRALGSFGQQFQINLPLGFSSPGAVQRLLNIPAAVTYVVPQVVVLDQTGTIREQSNPMGSANLQDESYLRNLIGTLLAESQNNSK